MIAYHFVGDTLRDGRPIPADGDWLEHDGPLKLCASGLHASKHPFDALTYAPGPTRFAWSSATAKPSRATTRSCVAVAGSLPASTRPELLREYARWCALQVIHLWDAPEVVRLFLAGDESLRDAARAAAWAAARAAARDAQRAQFKSMVEARFGESK